MVAGEQLVEHNSQGVDVTGGRNRCASHLLRAGVSGRENAKHRHCGLQTIPEGAGIENLCDSKVQQFGLTTAGHKDVAGDRKSTRLNSSHPSISYAVFCL